MNGNAVKVDQQTGQPITIDLPARLPDILSAVIVLTNSEINSSNISMRPVSLCLVALACIFTCPYAFSSSSVSEHLSRAGNDRRHEVKAQKRELSLYIDPGDRRQVIQGFGASDAWSCQFVGKNWPLKKRERMADLLFSRDLDRNGDPKGIGLSLWRFYIGAGSAEQGVSSGIPSEWRRAECFENSDGSYDWGKQEGQRWFLQAARRRGVEKFLAFTIAPPVFLSANGKAWSNSGSSMNIRPGKLADYAEFLVNVLKHLQEDEEIEFDYLSPVNEPQWDWGPPARQEGTGALNTEVAAFVRLLSERLSARKLKTEIAFGEAARLNYLYDDGCSGRDRQIHAFFDAGSPLYVGNLPNVARIISGHSYFTTSPVTVLNNTRARLRRELKEVADPPTFWQSEYCPLGNNSGEINGDGRDLGMRSALYVAYVIHHDLTTADAGSWQWWLAVSPHDYKDGLVYIDNGTPGDLTTTKYDGFVRPSKILWALGNYSRFVRPGMRRVEARIKELTPAADLTNSLMASAYVDPTGGKLVIVIVNRLNSEKRIALRGPPLSTGPASSFFVKGNTFTTWTTSATKSLKRGSARADNILVEPRSVVTLTASITSR
jgi:hypothetical protein